MVGGQFRQFFIGFLFYELLPPAREKPLVVENRYLSVQLARGPILIGGFIHVQFASLIFFYSLVQAIMGPAYLCQIQISNVLLTPD